MTEPAPARHRWLLAVMLLVQVLLVWPVYALVPAIYPFVLGLPLSFAWLGFCILITFMALLVTFCADMRAAGKRERNHDHAD
ncbi:MAG TPA: hypothetical protein VFX47_02710 [Gammaproteobacteria bacterium]|nr:hypothetical protein [Gammaproteobacteria bacterium]